MSDNKHLINKVLGSLNGHKWKIITKLKLNNLKVNRILRPINKLESEKLPIAIKKLDLSSHDYNNLINVPVLKKYQQINYAYSKPIEYLTTLTLLDLQGGDQILDAAGGKDAEYIRAVMAASPFKLTAYCQDSLLGGKSNDGITYIGGSIDAIPLQNESLDGISCHHSFEHFRDDLDIRFIQEAVRLLRVGKKLVIAPLFLTNEYAEIWNTIKIQHFDPEQATTIFDATATFAGWGPYEGFARTYSPEAFKARIIDNLPSNCEAQLYQIFLDGKPVPDIKQNYHQPLLNAEMKALVITKNRIL
ncbi:MAG: methyltransferase domain-containing protein [Crinalium sp.]